MSVNPDSIPRYEEYPAETEPTPKECMLRCDHFGACSRLYEMLVDDTDAYGWQSDMALRFGCDECEEWYGKPW